MFEDETAEPGPHKVRAVNATLIEFEGQHLITLQDDGCVYFPRSGMGRKESFVVAMALMGRLLTAGVIESGQSVDEALHTLEMICRDDEPF